MLLSSTGSYTLGCEITDRSIKTIQLKRGGLTPRIFSIGHTRLKSGIVVNGKIEDYESLKKAMESAVAKLKGKKLFTNDAVLSLPDSQTFVKTVSIKKPDDDNFQPLIEKAIQKHFPLDSDEAIFDSQILSTSNSHARVIIAAANKSIIEPYTKLCSDIGWHVFAFELESQAIARALLGKDLGVNALIIDIGYAHSSLIIVSNNTLQFTLSLPISGKMINETISQKLKLTPEQAERAKIKCGLDETKCKGAIKIVLDAILDDIAFKVEDALDYYATNMGIDAPPIESIIITGGGAYLNGIEQALSIKTKRTVIKGDPTKFVRDISPKAFPELSKTKLHSFVTAIGLAQRNIYSKYL